MMLKKSVLAATLWLWPLIVAAQTAYVTDSLRLGLHEASDTSDQPFANLVSGTALEILERNASYARVRDPDGREGWVKAAFLVEAKPALARVAELESELAELKAAVATADAAQRVAEDELRRASTQTASFTGSAEAVHDTVRRLQAENRAYEQRFETYRYSLPVAWVVVAVLVAAATGFASGVWWLDARIRRRHGGFRIY